MSKHEWRGEIFNLGTAKNYSINELAAMYGQDVQYIPERPGESSKTLADISFTNEKLGYKPTIDLKDYVADWLREIKSLEITD